MDAHRLALVLLSGMYQADGAYMSVRVGDTAAGYITRRPVGLQAPSTLPSTLDYFAVSLAVEFVAIGIWVEAHADHAVMGLQSKRPLRRPRRGNAQMALSALGRSVGVGLNLQQPGADRRADRYPYEVRILAVWASRAPDAARRAVRFQHMRAARRRAHRREQAARMAIAVRSGRAPERDFALKDVKEQRDGDLVIVDAPEMLLVASEAFARTWGAQRPGAWLRVLGLMLAREGHRAQLGEEDMRAAFASRPGESSRAPMESRPTRYASSSRPPT